VCRDHAGVKLHCTVILFRFDISSSKDAFFKRRDGQIGFVGAGRQQEMKCIDGFSFLVNRI
jgi:hypothetical protein